MSSGESMNDMDSDDQSERMDLALNSDLCSVFLECWDETTTSKPEKYHGGSSAGSRTPTFGERHRLWEGEGNDKATMCPSDLPPYFGDETTLYAGIAASTRKAAESSSETLSNSSAAVGTAAPYGTKSDQEKCNNTQSSDATLPSRSTMNGQQSMMGACAEPGTTGEHTMKKLHPQGITSAAECPPHHETTPNVSSTVNSSLPGVPNMFTNSHLGFQQGLAASFSRTPCDGERNMREHTDSDARRNVSTNPQPQNPPPPQSSLPPFLLFDAPMELRANFVQSQRAHGMPVLEDNNSYHYGMVVNGFHPQSSNIHLLDGRHMESGNKRVKNAKEQKRAQQITHLIDQLRIKMEKDGWKVGLKSKFHTLSSCAEYVKHLVRSNRLKEESIARVKQDIKAKQRQLQEDKAQQDPSDPESTTSDLTESSGSAGIKARVDSKNHPKPVGAAGGTSSDEYYKRKKARMLESHESTISSVDSSGGDESRQPREDQQQQQACLQTVSAGQTGSSISDVTNSNIGSSMNSNSGTRTDGNGDAHQSVSSDAAVVSGTSHHHHADVVIQGDKRKSWHVTGTIKSSFDGTFGIDYEEVFVKSNVPQLLATPSGRVIASNEFFLKVTGLQSSEVQQLTIFSLVKSTSLAKLFEIVAAALKNESPDSSGSDATSSGVEPKDGQARVEDFAALTLPCVYFPRNAQQPGKNRQLFMTVTLMTDSDPRKRCFHCIFTDNPGTNGCIGNITSELMSSLFSAPAVESVHGKKRKAHGHHDS